MLKHTPSRAGYGVCILWNVLPSGSLRAILTLTKILFTFQNPPRVIFYSEFVGCGRVRCGSVECGGVGCGGVRCGSVGCGSVG